MKETFKVVKLQDGCIVVEDHTGVMVSDKLVSGYVNSSLYIAEIEMNKCKPLVEYLVNEGRVDKDYLMFLQYATQRIAAIKMKMMDPHAF